VHEAMSTVYLLEPLTKRAKSWIRDNLQSGYQSIGKAVCVEHRFIMDIVEGMKRDGLILGKDFLVGY